jgi:hypothetical protein
MSTVASRIIRSSPYRDSVNTWLTIIELLSRGKAGAAREQLTAITGIASSLMADRSAESAPIVVTCNGPRTRIYCLYDEDALDDSRANEDALGFDPLKGDWAVSLPCPAGDLAWVQRALKEKGTRITARDESVGVNEARVAETVTSKSEAIVDTQSFFKS